MMQKKRVVVSSAVFLPVICLWPVLTVITMPAGTPSEQLAAVAAGPGGHILNFIVAMLIGPALVLMLSAYRRTRPDYTNPGTGRLVFVLYLLYLLLITFSYASQAIILPVLLHRESADAAMNWFFYNSVSIPYLVNQTAYLSWSLATIAAFIHDLAGGTGLSRWIAVTLLLSAFMQASATMGLYIGLESLNSLTSAAGLLLVPAGVLILVSGIRE